MKVAIHQNKDVFHHSTNWSYSWTNYCEKHGIEYQVVDCFDPDILEILKGYDILLWHFNNFSFQEMLFARSILYSAKNMGLKVFPDFNTSWHFDDKVAEMYLLSTVEAPLPKYWTFYTLNSYKEWINHKYNYPVIAKLRCGSGSGNVKLIHDKKEALRYGENMFRRGIKSAPKVLFKTKSNLKSAKNMNTVVTRIKRIPDFLQTVRSAKEFPREKGYVFLQEFVPNDGYDLKIAVVGDKLSFIARKVRSGDFRASGGGSLYFDRSLVTPDIIKSAFQTSDRLGLQCMGYDYVVDNRNMEAKMIEMSYGFSHKALIQAGGYWDREGSWHEEPLNAAEEVLKIMIS